MKLSNSDRANRAFHDLVLNGAAELRFCDKRIVFYENGAPKRDPKTGKINTAPFDSILVVYRPGTYRTPSVSTWVVPPHVPAKSSTPATSTQLRNPEWETHAQPCHDPRIQTPRGQRPAGVLQLDRELSGASRDCP